MAITTKKSCRAGGRVAPPARLLFSLFLGIIATIATAWLITLLQTLPATQLEVAWPGPWPDGCPAGWPAAPNTPTAFESVISTGRNTVGMTTARRCYYPADPSSPGRYTSVGYMADTFQTGWPWRALEATRFEAVTAAGVPTSSPLGPAPWAFWHEGVLDVPTRFIEGTPFQQRRLPIRPMLAGFFGDTLVFGAGAWGLITSAVLIRHRLRVSKGHCGACGYDLDGAPRCPECGTALLRG